MKSDYSLLDQESKSLFSHLEEEQNLTRRKFHYEEFFQSIDAELITMMESYLYEEKLKGTQQLENRIRIARKTRQSEKSVPFYSKKDPITPFTLYQDVQIIITCKNNLHLIKNNIFFSILSDKMGRSQVSLRERVKKKYATMTTDDLKYSVKNCIPLRFDAFKKFIKPTLNQFEPDEQKIKMEPKEEIKNEVKNELKKQQKIKSQLKSELKEQKIKVQKQTQELPIIFEQSAQNQLKPDQVTPIIKIQQNNTDTDKTKQETKVEKIQPKIEQKQKSNINLDQIIFVVEGDTIYTYNLGNLLKQKNWCSLIEQIQQEQTAKDKHLKSKNKVKLRKKKEKLQNKPNL